MSSAQVQRLATTYAAFLNYAFDRDQSRFRNFMSFDRRWLEEAGSDDCHGRALWALGACVGRSKRRDLQFWASQLFDLALPALTETTSPRAWAFGLLGVCHVSPAAQRRRQASQVRDTLTDRLIASFEQDRAPTNGRWFEDDLTYDNARLCRAPDRQRTVRRACPGAGDRAARP